MDNKLIELSKGDFDVALVHDIKSEREKILSEVERMTQILDNVFSNKAFQKKEDYGVLQRGLAKLCQQYIQFTDAFISNIKLLEGMNQENMLLGNTNKVLEEEIVAERKILDENQREISSNIMQLTEEKAGLRHTLNEIKTEIAEKQAENNRLDKEIEKLEQENIRKQPLNEVQRIESETQNMIASLLKEKAQIADLFLNLKAKRKKSEVVDVDDIVAVREELE